MRRGLWDANTVRLLLRERKPIPELRKLGASLGAKVSEHSLVSFCLGGAKGPVLEFVFTDAHPEAAVQPRGDEGTLEASSVIDLELELVRRSGRNEFHGAKIAKDLLANRTLWISLIFLREDFAPAIDRSHPVWHKSLITLRDMPQGDYNADHLTLIAPSRKAADALAAIGKKRWQPDETIIPEEEVGPRAYGAAPGEWIVDFWWD
jgi:hypothetical protein